MAFQEAPSPPMTPALRTACASAVHVITPEGEILRAGRAALYCLERCGWSVPARIAGIPPLVWLVEAGYWIVARYRPFFARFLFTNERDPKPFG